jgi:kynurenine formamidase
MTPASIDEFRAVADRVRNWGRWGEDDQLGTLNFITPEVTRDAATVVRRGDVFALGVEFNEMGPQGVYPHRTNVLHFMTVAGGYDSYSESARAARQATAQTLAADNLFRYNDDYVVMPLQAATQWDALSHAYYEGKMYNGFPSTEVTEFGAAKLSVDHMARHGVVTRGVLADVVAHRGGGMLSPERPVTPEELDDVLKSQGVSVRAGDVLLVRTGFWENFLQTGDRGAFHGGVSWRCAEWIHDKSLAAVATDSVCVEPLSMTPEVDGVGLPLHCLCLRDLGLPLGEFWNLGELASDCAADGVFEFQLIAPALRFTGAVGSPINPIAVK